MEREGRKTLPPTPTPARPLPPPPPPKKKMIVGTQIFLFQLNDVCVPLCKTLFLSDRFKKKSDFNISAFMKTEVSAVVGSPERD